MRGPKPGQTPIVNHMNFTDARPTIGSPSTTFNPGGAVQASPLPKGPPKYIQPGNKRNIGQGLTNKRFQYN